MILPTEAEAEPAVEDELDEENEEEAEEAEANGEGGVAAENMFIHGGVVDVWQEVPPEDIFLKFPDYSPKPMTDEEILSAGKELVYGNHATTGDGSAAADYIPPLIGATGETGASTRLCSPLIELKTASSDVNVNQGSLESATGFYRSVIAAELHMIPGAAESKRPPIAEIMSGNDAGRVMSAAVKELDRIRKYVSHLMDIVNRFTNTSKDDISRVCTENGINLDAESVYRFLAAMKDSIYPKIKSLFDEIYGNLENSGDDDRTVRISEYIRVVATGYLIYPSVYGGMGIGNSQSARTRMDKINASEQKPKPVDPNLPFGKWLMPPPKPADMDKMEFDDFRLPVDELPNILKNYIAYLSKGFLRGMMRICFSEFGFKSYILHRSSVIRDAIAGSMVKNGEAPDQESALQKLMAENPPHWDYTRMFNLVHEVIPRLVMKALIAPMSQTTNLDNSIIRQNRAYLTDYNAELIQEMVDPIEDKVTSNLEIGNDGKEMSYLDSLKETGTPEYSMPDVMNRAEYSSSGQKYKYSLNAGDDISDGEPDEQGLQFCEVSSDNTEYASAKCGNWYIARIDKYDGAEDEYNAKGWIKFDGPGVARTGQHAHRFYFRGGNKPSNVRDDYEGPKNGVGLWCWTWHGYFDDYRKYDEGDIAYMIIHENALSPEVLSVAPRNRDEAISTRGSAYDSSAFGIVIAGSDADDSDDIPGLVKHATIEARNDTTYEYDDLQPGQDNAVKYDERFVPYGGKIPGLLEVSDYDSDMLQYHAECINNSIFSLALIGKWDNSIHIGFDGEDFQCDELIALVQKWFPSHYGGNDSQRQIANTETSMPELRFRDMSTAGMVLGEKDETGDISSVIWRIAKVDWKVFSTMNDPDTYIMVEAEPYFALKGQRTRNEIPEEEYVRRLGELRSIAFMRYEGTVYPVTTTPEPFNELNAKVDRIRSEMQAAETAGVNKNVEPEIDAEGVKWFPAPRSSARNRIVGVDDEANMYLRDVSSGEDPVSVSANGVFRRLFSGGLVTVERATFTKIGDNAYNVWLMMSFGGEKYPVITYIRKPRIMTTVSTFRLETGSTFIGTSNAILRKASDEGFENSYALGDITGNLARLNRLHANQYIGYIDFSSSNQTIDSVGIDADALHGLKEEFEGKVGLVVSTVGRRGANVGVIDWYDAGTMEFTGSKNITTDMLDRHAGELPHRFNW